MKLVIVESPTKAKTLSKLLDKDYVIKASMGHIRDLPKSGLGVDVEHDFTPEYEVPDKAKKTINELKKLAKDTNDIVLATDPDREGEAIAWHLKTLLTPKTKKESAGLKFSRVVFHELTKHALDEAFNNPGELNVDLVNAQQARRVLDRLVGYKLSPLLWKKVRFGLSAGRVQSVAVRIVVERERERTAFNPEEYWSIDGLFTDDKKVRSLKSELFQKGEKKLKITNADEAKKLETELNTDSFSISEVKKSERKKNPYPPFKTSTLQQSMANVFGFSAKKTMDAAQKLFEKGFITYHRTDSFNLSEDFIKNARAFISDKYGKNFLPESAIYYKTKEKNAQEAHEAIRPTELTRVPDSKSDLTADEQKTYTLIWMRSLESQMLPAIYDQTTIIIKSEKEYLFKTTGSIIKFDGWLAVSKKLNITEDEEELNSVDAFTEGEKVLLSNLDSQQHFTQPPARYSDATLIKALEEIGVGRPSTYAPTLSTIQARGYVEKEGRYYKPKDVAFVVNDLLVEHFPSIVDYTFTAKMEEDLDDIADGKKEWVPIIREFYTPFEKILEKKDKELKKHDITTLEITDEKCPECGKVLVVKLGKFGKFLSCSGYPECEYAQPMEEDLVLDENGKEIEDFGKCPNCEGGHFVLKRGRFGKFLACSNYPKCKTTKPFLEKIGVSCPKCTEGDVVVKKAKGRTFFGCSRYPDCDWSSWKDPRLVAGAENGNPEEVTTVATDTAESK